MASSDAPEPVERKVQLTGGSTYTVSLPKEWAREQSIEPGCMVTLYSRDDRLLITRGDDPDDRQVATAESSDLVPAELRRLVRTAYLTGVAELRLRGAVGADQRRAVEDAASSLVGFDVDYRAEDAVAVRSMLDASDLSLQQALVQLRDVVLAMQEAAIEAVVGEAAAEAVHTQRGVVDRLSALVARQFQRSIARAGAAVDIDRLTAFDYERTARVVERIAGHAEVIAEAAEGLDGAPPEDLATEIERVGERSRTLVGRGITELLDSEAADGVDPGSDGTDDIVAEAETLRAAIADLDRGLYGRDLAETHRYGLVLDRLDRIAAEALVLAEIDRQAAVRDA